MATFSLLHLFKANGRIHRCFTHGGIWTTDIWCRRPQFCQLHQSGHTTCTLTTCGIMTTGMRKNMPTWCQRWRETKCHFGVLTKSFFFNEVKKKFDENFSDGRWIKMRRRSTGTNFSSFPEASHGGHLAFRPHQDSWHSGQVFSILIQGRKKARQSGGTIFYKWLRRQRLGQWWLSICLKMLWVQSTIDSIWQRTWYCDW